MLREGVKKWKSKCGESIAEALVAMLVIVLAGMMLAGAITASARLNSASAKMAVFPQYAGENGSDAVATVSGGFTSGTAFNAGIPVRVYKDAGEMYYYEKR